MPTWTYVTPYEDEALALLVGFGLRGRAIVPGNRPPTVAEITAACERLCDLLEVHLIEMDCFDAEFSWEQPHSVATTLCLRGDCVGHWHLLLALAESMRCSRPRRWRSSSAGTPTTGTSGKRCTAGSIVR